MVFRRSFNKLLLTVLSTVNMEGEQVREFNIRVLRHHDPAVIDILDQASYVVVYRFDAEAESWSRAGFAGSAFLVQRSEGPVSALVVLNRLGMDNFTYYLESSDHIDLNPEFVICKDTDDAIWGIWIFDANDRRRLADAMVKCASRVAIAPVIPESTPSTNILSALFDKAIREHQKANATNLPADEC